MGSTPLPAQPLLQEGDSARRDVHSEVAESLSSLTHGAHPTETHSAAGATDWLCKHCFEMLGLLLCVLLSKHLLLQADRLFPNDAVAAP